MSDIAYTPILPEGWPRPRGFSHAVVATGTRSVRIAGQIGREPAQAHIPADTDAGTQWRIALSNLVTVLKAAGGQPEHLVALRAYVTDIAEFNAAGAAVGAAWGAALGRHFPAMTLVQVSALIDPNAKVEIEGEAILP
ncbi:MAG: RidA family protein [Reyranella sp.]|uniref:RidA family protein n=1 Tax=Reyranella sp. TaxID=1929291 RepID=UPI0012180247|nr:RidA family protein [Reyranella sp.]TAJ96287.1 MAG: RidA family protein [Reyranella sp.]